jgi:hypothetical protein
MLDQFQLESLGCHWLGHVHAGALLVDERASTALLVTL